MIAHEVIQTKFDLNYGKCDLWQVLLMANVLWQM